MIFLTENEVRNVLLILRHQVRRHPVYGHRVIQTKIWFCWSSVFPLITGSISWLKTVFHLNVNVTFFMSLDYRRFCSTVWSVGCMNFKRSGKNLCVASDVSLYNRRLAKLEVLRYIIGPFCAWLPIGSALSTSEVWNVRLKTHIFALPVIWPQITKLC
jgi:hypothetical protein